MAHGGCRNPHAVGDVYVCRYYDLGIASYYPLRNRTPAASLSTNATCSISRLSAPECGILPVNAFHLENEGESDNA